MPERETLIEAGIAVGVALLFIVVVVAVGAMFGGEQLTSTGAFAMVGGIALFLVLMAAAGYWLAGREA